jgi:hypothetical protein
METVLLAAGLCGCEVGEGEQAAPGSTRHRRSHVGESELRAGCWLAVMLDVELSDGYSLARLWGWWFAGQSERGVVGYFTMR